MHCTRRFLKTIWSRLLEGVLGDGDHLLAALLSDGTFHRGWLAAFADFAVQFLGLVVRRREVDFLLAVSSGDLDGRAAFVGRLQLALGAECLAFELLILSHKGGDDGKSEQEGEREFLHISGTFSDADLRTSQNSMSQGQRCRPCMIRFRSRRPPGSRCCLATSGSMTRSCPLASWCRPS